MNDPSFQEARHKADQAHQRALLLAASPDAGIPPEGGGFLLRRDPFTHGQAVLEKKCLGCHFLDGKGTGAQTAADLKNFGSRAWVAACSTTPEPTPITARSRGSPAWSSGRRTPSSKVSSLTTWPISSPALPPFRPTSRPMSG